MAAIFALIHGEKGAYGISFPDFQGCVAGGATVAEAIERGREGLSLHLDAMIEDGEPMPKPRDLDEIKADASFAEEIGDAVAIVALDLELPGKPVCVSVSLDGSLLDRIDHRAAELGETRNDFLAAAARARLAS
jgi:predicted RNase H-like HicB family nuclease